MKYLIDGYNLGFKNTEIAPWIERGDTDRAVQILVQKINNIIGKDHQAVLVMDGKEGYFFGNFGTTNIKVIFSKKPETADDIIRRKIRKEKKPQDWTIVSSDHEIQNTARAMGAQVMKSEAFINRESNSPRMSTPREPDEKYHPEATDMDYWLKLFGE